MENALTQVSRINPVPGSLVMVGLPGDLDQATCAYIGKTLQEWYPGVNFIFCPFDVNLFELPEAVMNQLGWYRAP